MKSLRKIFSVILIFSLLLSVCAMPAAAKNPADAMDFLIKHIIKDGKDGGFGLRSIAGDEVIDSGDYGDLHSSGPQVYCNAEDTSIVEVYASAYYHSVRFTISASGTVKSCYLSAPGRQESVSIQPSAIYKDTKACFTTRLSTEEEQQEAEKWMPIAFHRALAFLDSQLRIGGYTLADLGFTNYGKNAPEVSCSIYAEKCLGARFADMPAGDNWAHNAIDWAILQNITSGTSLTTFSPDEDCTRAQIVTFLWRFCGSPEPEAVENPFTDVKEDAYYYKAVLWAVSQSITNGTSEDCFDPEGKCTRGQVVTFLWRLNDCVLESADSAFTDIAQDAYYADAVNWAVSREITNGTGDGKFSPEAPCTRAQVVTFLYRAQNFPV